MTSGVKIARKLLPYWFTFLAVCATANCFISPKDSEYWVHRQWLVQISIACVAWALAVFFFQKKRSI
jgi:intracellular septation protein A